MAFKNPFKNNSKTTFSELSHYGGEWATNDHSVTKTSQTIEMSAQRALSGSLVTNLNADMLDGHHSDYFAISGAGAVETDPLSLHLNQTTPQVVISGIPTFQNGLKINDKGSTATYILDVHEDDSTPFLAGFYNDTYSGATPVMEYYANNGGQFYMGTPKALSFGFYTNGANNLRLFLPGYGGVGINTIVPDAQLDVACNSNANGIRLWNKSLAGTKAWVFYPVTNGSNTDMKLYEYGTTNADRFIFKTGGYFGIGTMTPSTHLDVKGNTSLSGACYISGVLTISTNISGALIIKNLKKIDGTTAAADGDALKWEASTGRVYGV